MNTKLGSLIHFRSWRMNVSVSPRTSLPKQARLKAGLAVAYPKLLAWAQEPHPKIPFSTLLLLRRCCPQCAVVSMCGVLQSVALSWRLRGHGGGASRRLVYRAAGPQLRGGRLPPAPQCPMASRSQLLCRPSNLTSPKAFNC